MADSTREQLRPVIQGFNAVLVAVVNLLASALLTLQRQAAISRFRAGDVRRRRDRRDRDLGPSAAGQRVTAGLHHE